MNVSMRLQLDLMEAYSAISSDHMEHRLLTHFNDMYCYSSSIVNCSLIGGASCN